MLPTLTNTNSKSLRSLFGTYKHLPLPTDSNERRTTHMLKYRVTVEFTAPADKPHVVEDALAALKEIGAIVKIHASATKAAKE